MKKRGIWLIAAVVLVVVAAVVLAACGSSTTTTTAGVTTTAAGATTTAGGTVDAAALFAQNCAGCHKSVPNGSADSVKATIESGKGSMPSFSGKLTADQISALATWVANGGK